MRRPSWPVIVLGFFAIAFLISSVVEGCPSYVLFGLSTRLGDTAMAVVWR